LEFPYFGLLDVLDLVSFHIDFLSNLSSLFQVVQSILLLNIFVIRNLGSDLVRVFDEGLLSIFFDLPLLQLDLLLLLDLVHVVFSFDASLLSKGRSLLRELLLSSFFEVSLDSHPLCLLELFSFSGLSLALLESSLGSQSVDFSLSISCLLLEFSQTLSLPLLLLSHSLGLLLLFVLSLILFALMFRNLGIVILFFLNTFLLFEESLGICFCCLLHE